MTPQTSKDESSVTFKKKKEREKKTEFFFPNRYPLRWWQIPPFLPLYRTKSERI